VPIHFFTEAPLEFSLDNENIISDWLSTVIKDYGYKLEDLNYIFCNDDFILDINKTYLKHDYYTDVITFDQSENEMEIEGDIFISIDTVRSNSEKYRTYETKELHRVMVHGLLHLLGMSDKTEDSEKEMRSEENKWIEVLKKQNEEN